TESEEEDYSDERRPRPFYYPGGISIGRPSSAAAAARRRTNGDHPAFSGIRQVGSFPRSVNEWEKKSRASRQPHSRSPTRNRLRLRGSLLWSNHWFFVNRKQKRVLFISIWATTRGYGFSPSGASGVKSSVDGSYSTGLRSSGGGSGGALGSERFLGWQGAQGAGARAFAARKAGSSLF
ncbi:1608_t:CDS:1, partial [Acaulospora colombiana]